MRISARILVLAVLVLAGGGCGGSETPPVASDGLPGPVAETRSAILAAAESDEYAPLRDVLDPDSFLSDFGFGEEPDPVGGWEQKGPAPLETMAALLRMPYVVRETNEGTLYQWPRFDPDSKSAAELTAAERDLMLTFMTEEELTRAFNPEYGYTAPRLGILADGDWWFLVLEPGP